MLKGIFVTNTNHYGAQHYYEVVIVTRYKQHCVTIRKVCLGKNGEGKNRVGKLKVVVV